jgi:hypothetical protein
MAQSLRETLVESVHCALSMKNVPTTNQRDCRIRTLGHRTIVYCVLLLRRRKACLLAVAVFRVHSHGAWHKSYDLRTRKQSPQYSEGCTLNHLQRRTDAKSCVTGT